MKSPSDAGWMQASQLIVKIGVAKTAVAKDSIFQAAPPTAPGPSPASCAAHNAIGHRLLCSTAFGSTQITAGLHANIPHEL